MMYDAHIHLFCKFGGIRGYRLAEKWLEAKKQTKSLFLPLDSSQDNLQLF